MCNGRLVRPNPAVTFELICKKLRNRRVTMSVRYQWGELKKRKFMHACMYDSAWQTDMYDARSTPSSDCHAQILKYYATLPSSPIAAFLRQRPLHLTIGLSRIRSSKSLICSPSSLLVSFF